jgi:hypothetical protein
MDPSEDEGAETISLVEPSVSRERVIDIKVHYNIIVIKSNIPGVEPKAFIVPSLNGEMTSEQKADFIARERAKMEADAKAKVSITETAVIDPSGGAELVVTDPSGERVE